MKKILLVLIVILISLSSLVGCNVASDIYWNAKGHNHSLYYIPQFDDLHSYEDITHWIRFENEIYYKTEGSTDVWKDPEQTIADKGGDCEDLALLFINIAYYALGEELSMALVEQDGISIVSDKAIVEGGEIDHAMVVLSDGNLYDPLYQWMKEGDVGYILKFADLFNY